MKKVLLLGDSIRRGYDNYTKDRLNNIAEVYFPSDNCMYAENVLRFITEWPERLGVKASEIDVIHWNAGLWDCLIMEDGLPMTTIEAYEVYIGRIQGIIEMFFPNAVSIFATSTSVCEEMWKWKGRMRYNSMIEKYNEAAKRALSSHNVKINDLYSLLAPLPSSYHSDATHFYTPEATELIGSQVLSFITDALGIEKSALDCANGDYSPDKIIGI